MRSSWKLAVLALSLAVGGQQARAQEDPGEPPAEALSLAEEMALERITFEVPLSTDTGGGIATGTAGALEYLRSDLVVLSRAVEFEYQGLRLQADKVTVDLGTKDVVAEGNVILDEGPRRMSGARLEFDLDSKTGTVYEGRAFVDPDVYFDGAEIAKVGEDRYTVRDGTITSCSEDRTPDWSFKMGKARVNLQGFARVKNSRLRVKKLPVFYAPYMLFPAKRGRVSGFLFPNFGHSSRRGTTLGLAYFQTLGNSYDATIYGDIYADDYLGLGTEFRYRPSHTTSGIAQLYGIDDSVENETRWKANWRHSSERLPFGMRGQISYRDFSDFDFFRDFERDFNDISIRSLYSNGFVTGNWGLQSLNIMLDQRQTFIRNGVQVTQRQLPEIEYRVRSVQLGQLPLYFGFETSANYFQIERTESLQTNYSRVDLLPTLTLPMSYWPWLTATVAASGRATWYGDSLTTDGSGFSGESLSRTFPAGQLTAVGPSLSRIYDKSVGSFAKFKHIIEPNWVYSYIGEFDDRDLIPLFDEIDRVQDRTIVGFSIVNRLLAKPEDEELGGGAREILSLEIGQQFSLRDEQPFQASRDGSLATTDGPIGALLRFVPSRNTSLELRTRYSTLFNELDQTTLLGGLRRGQHAVSLSWVKSRNAELGNVTSEQARLGTDIMLVPNRLRMQNQFNYNFVTGFMQQQRHVLYYTSQCYGLRLEFRERETATIVDRDIRLGISLKNIGSFLDMGFGGSGLF